MEENGNNRAEAIRLLEISEKLLQNSDFNGSREFAILAQEAEPLLDGSDQIIAIVDVLLAAENQIYDNQHDWYSVLQIDHRSDDNNDDTIKKQYRRLALLLHPDKNKFPFADQAFKLVADAWAVLSNGSKKSVYDKEIMSLSTRFDSIGGKLPVTEEGQQKYKENVQRAKPSTFWTACPYCYRLFEYPGFYEDCCLRCQNCERAFHAVLIPTLPPLVPGQEAYYCCWAFFPLEFVSGNHDGGVKPTPPSGFRNWMPPMFPGMQNGGNLQPTATPPRQPPMFPGSERNGGYVPPTVTPPPPPIAATKAVSGVSRGNASDIAPRKRGRPRKNPL